MTCHVLTQTMLLVEVPGRKSANSYTVKKRILTSQIRKTLKKMKKSYLHDLRYTAPFNKCK